MVTFAMRSSGSKVARLPFSLELKKVGSLEDYVKEARSSLSGQLKHLSGRSATEPQREGSGEAAMIPGLQLAVGGLTCVRVGDGGA